MRQLRGRGCHHQVAIQSDHILFLVGQLRLFTAPINFYSLRYFLQGLKAALRQDFTETWPCLLSVHTRNIERTMHAF